MLEIPDVVVAKARASGAQTWLADLPTTVASLAADWGLSIGSTFTDATEALVLAVERSDGSAGVLKVLVPRGPDVARLEIAVLDRADGEGLVRLLASDIDRGALLLERLGPSLADLGLPYTQRIDILCDVAQQVWRPAGDLGLTTGAEKADWLIGAVEELWERLGRPCTRSAVDHAIACASRRRAAHRDDTSVLVHGDVHQWNALRRGDEFVLVDPDGLLAEPEYDLGVIVREDPDETLREPVGHRSQRLARRAGLDAEAIEDWGAIERVSTGLLCRDIGLEPVGTTMLQAADHIAGAV